MQELTTARCIVCIFLALFFSGDIDLLNDDLLLFDQAVHEVLRCVLGRALRCSEERCRPIDCLLSYVSLSVGLVDAFSISLVLARREASTRRSISSKRPA